MKALENIEVGQEVVFGGKSVEFWQVGYITKITKTSFTVQPENYNGTAGQPVRFNKANGVMWGDGDSWGWDRSRTQIKGGGWNEPLMTRLEMEQRQAAQKENDTRSRIARLITNTNARDFANTVSLADLTKAAQLLGVSLVDLEDE